MGSIELNFSDSAQGVIQDLQRKISELPERTVNLVEDIADMFEVLATDEAPVLFGDLQGSIYTENTGLLERLITPHIEYAVYVHEGHMTRGKEPWFVPANPYMDRASDRGEPYVESLSNEFVEWLTE